MHSQMQFSNFQGQESGTLLKKNGNRNTSVDMLTNSYFEISPQSNFDEEDILNEKDYYVLNDSNELG